MQQDYILLGVILSLLTHNFSATGTLPCQVDLIWENVETNRIHLVIEKSAFPDFTNTLVTPVTNTLSSQATNFSVAYPRLLLMIIIYVLE